MIRRNSHQHAIALVVDALLAIGLLASTSTLSFGQAGTWKKTGNMKTARDAAGATLLQNGQVLVAGGDGSTSLILTLLQNGEVLIVAADSELYNPATRTWTVTGPPNTTRYSATQTLLPNGKVLLAGGTDRNCVTPPCNLSSAELYDPFTGTWSPTGSMTTAHSSHTATLLANGLVLVAGGFDAGVIAELYNPATGKWTATGSMNAARGGHFAALLPSGKVLVLFGNNPPVTTADLYDPATGTWTVNGSAGATAQAGFSVTLLATGKVLVAGGDNCFYPRPCTDVNSAELYDPSVGASTSTGSLNIARSGHSAILLPNGQVLAAGGSVQKPKGSSGPTSSAEFYTP